MIFSGSGLVFLGGLIGGTIAVTIILNKNKLPWLEFADIVAPLILGYGIGRIGCFLVGDDYGTPTELPWGMSFPNGLPPSTTSIFSSIFHGLIFQYIIQVYLKFTQLNCMKHLYQ